VCVYTIFLNHFHWLKFGVHDLYKLFLLLLKFVCVYSFCEMPGASPYEALLVADAGDVNLTMYNVPEAVNDIHRQYTKLLSTGCKLLSIGGDHTITYPILKAHRVCDEF